MMTERTSLIQRFLLYDLFIIDLSLRSIKKHCGQWSADNIKKHVTSMSSRNAVR